MIALFDVGNTHTHIGLANSSRVLRRIGPATADWSNGQTQMAAEKFLRGRSIQGAAFCSVVPAVTPLVSCFIHEKTGVHPLALTARSVRGIGIAYPKPWTIGPDRLANAMAARHRFGAPVVVVDFGTAVTFDVVDRRGNYIGGIIAPGLNVMTDYLHEKTALLPRVQIREVRALVGKSTVQAMRIGAVHGYRGLIAGLLSQLKRALGCRRLPVVATGGYAGLVAAKLPQITAVEPLLTLEGLRLAWEAHREERREKGGESPCLLCRVD
ncbi:MAG: type III pantothenate kinase [Verrucomicrobiota bacterium]|jgi:type III pantothenate kinase